MSNWFILTHALGAVQGVLLATILAHNRQGSVANRILSVAMFAFAVDLGTAVYHATGADVAFPHLIGIDFPLTFLYGPLLYLYARTLSRGEHVFRKVFLWHFLPYALLVVCLVPFYVQSGADKLAFVRDASGSPWGEVLGIVTHVKIVHALVYIGLILPLLRQHRERIRDTRSSAERMNLLWLRNLVVGIVALAALAVTFYLLSLRSDAPVMGLDPSTRYDDYMLLGLAILVYAIGYMALRQPEVFDGRLHAPHSSITSSPGFSEEVAETPADHRAPRAASSAAEADKRQYARSGMDAETAERHERALVALMEADRLYRRGDLTLQDLALASGISPHNITEVINTRLGQNFYDFVNAYRVREVRERLSDPANAHLTLLAIGMDAGFNSKSSFNAVFKKHTRMTPSQYRSQAHGISTA